MKFHKLDATIFNLDIWLIYDFKDLKEYSVWMQKHYKVSCPFADKRMYGDMCYHSLENLNTKEIHKFIVVPRKLDDISYNQYIALLSHEVLHCVFDNLDIVGFKYSKASEETYTYLHQAILQECLHHVTPQLRLKKRKKK